MTGRKSAQIHNVDRFKPRSDRPFLHRVVENVLDFTSHSGLEISVLLTDDDGIAELHGESLDDPTPTDVLSFGMDDSVDLVVNVQRAREEAPRRGTTLRADLALYVVHGMLHACGYDDGEERDRARMRAAERGVMERLGLRYAAVDD